eukprot:CAMPEP_0184673122 /NCGR_PEP_ID=MMETSP0308-20130426/86505_1 /TAXON_ID=38269 /ORGANISM="Gloeochaete witrockiana, Strain SAG 46.84" /LENGTH=166 /DNA_ID=CAMNT_0027120577 /DNA_START=332 /DNA_END=832 /DNA_ORIENTATION=-
MAYRKAWFYLYAAGVGAAYEESLKEFIRATAGAFLRGYSIEALSLEISANEITSGDPELDKYISLNQDEKAIRRIWMTVIYLTLNAVRYRPRDSKDWTRPVIQDTMSLEKLVTGVIEAKQRGYSLDALKLEQTLLLDTTGLSEVEASIRSQWMRIVFLALDVISED